MFRGRSGLWPVLGLLAVLAVSSVWTGWAAARGRSLHQAPIVLVGPDVVTAALAGEADDVPDPVLRVETSTSRDRARTTLAHGGALAVLELDLSGTSDRLVLPARENDRLDRRVTAEVRAVEARYDRVFDVARLPGDRSGHPGWLGLPASAPLAALLAAGLGFLFATVVSILRGPVARTFVLGTWRVGGLAALSLAGAAALTASGLDATSALALGLACLGTGTAALACEVMGGLRALVVAALLLVAAPLPLVVAGDRWLLGTPWTAVTDWTVVGAAAEILTRGPGAGPGLLPLIVLLGTPALSILLLVSSRLALRRVAGRPERVRSKVVRSVRAQLVVFAIGTVAFTVLSYVGWAALTHDEAAASRPSLASATRCLKTGSIDNVADLNRVAQLRGSAAMQGGDVGASARLQDGRTLWMFGDTLRNDTGHSGSFVRNSMLLVDPGCLEVVLPDSGGAIIPDRDDGVGYWPMSVLVSSHPGYDLVAVTAQRVRTTDATSSFGFANLGPAVAVYIVPVGKTPQLISRTDIGPDSDDTRRPMWGAAAIAQDGMAYLYGTARPPTVGSDSGFSLSLARVPVDEIDQQRRWRYWTGRTWSADPARAATLLPSKGGVSQTLSVFEQGGRWFALSKQNDFLGKDVVIWTAPGPTGPFVAHPPVAVLPSDAADGTLRYMPLAHPDLLPRKGTVVVSYSQNRTDTSEVLQDPRRYRPRFLRVPLPPS